MKSRLIDVVRTTLFAFVVGYLGALAARADAACAYKAVLVGGWSKHLITNKYGDDTWNETHRAIGFQCQEWAVMAFTNSHNKESYGIGREWTLYQRERLRAGVYGGVWSGYGQLPHTSSLIPVVSPTVTYSFGRLEARALVNPVVVVGYFGWRF